MNNKRLLKIAELFTERNIVDVGSDHAFLPIYLLDEKIISFATIIEINDGPLANAQRNILKKGYTKQTNIIKSDGLKKYIPNEECRVGIVIAGMGGNLITSILDYDITKLKNTVLYLQANNNEEEIRKFLLSYKFNIISEHLVLDDGIIYSLIKASTNGTPSTYTPTELKFGKSIKELDLFKQKWIEELKHFEKIKKQLEKNNHNTKDINALIKKILVVIGEK